ncbi:predicted protein [Uncinocarpus reesii 1704]|uniref:Uncharacterized protein n=1 Tax=Uncinocarpus reesii (strain UAMH 1704) TaxID=336963 RepID=C4JW75_UNCRE|nr:uncharacterized protein UREG_06817 [Uncinocarpus reesii 1704]EEP81952.1 predicted protein [Uncinocarpus reesii 1704]
MRGFQSGSMTSSPLCHDESATRDFLMGLDWTLLGMFALRQGHQRQATQNPAWNSNEFTFFHCFSPCFRMVLLVVTPLILAALESIPQHVRDELSLPAPKLDEAISHCQLIALSRKLSSVSYKHRTSISEAGKFEHGHVRDFSLNALLRGTKLYLPPQPPTPAPSPEYLALKARLEAEAQAKEYQSYLHRPSVSQSTRQPLPIFASSVINTPSSHAEDTFDDPSYPLVRS